jgi:hypothetical protein
MGRLRKYAELPRRKRVLVLEALAAVVAVRVGLTVLSFSRLRHWLDRAGGRRGKAENADELAWAVSAVSPVVPHATCLTQALALQVLLRRHGQSGELRIGVDKQGERVRAHAWVERDGKILIGQHGSSQFVPLT